MEKSRRVLVLGDCGVGKTTFLQKMFDFSSSALSSFPKKTEGCLLHVHHLNQHYPQLNKDSTKTFPASPSSTSESMNRRDFFLEFLDISGSLTKDISVNSRGQLTDPSQLSVLSVYLAQSFDAVIIAFDLSNVKSLDTLAKHFAIVRTLVNRVTDIHNLDHAISDM